MLTRGGAFDVSSPPFIEQVNRDTFEFQFAFHSCTLFFVDWRELPAYNATLVFGFTNIFNYLEVIALLSPDCSFSQMELYLDNNDRNWADDVGQSVIQNNIYLDLLKYSFTSDWKFY